MAPPPFRSEQKKPPDRARIRGESSRELMPPYGSSCPRRVEGGGGQRFPRAAHLVPTRETLGVKVTLTVVPARAEGVAGPSGQQEQQRNHQRDQDQWCKH